MNTRIENDVMAILGYSCETQAPNSAPTTEFMTDRWLKPRREQLAAHIEARLIEAWDAGYHARWDDSRTGRLTPNPYGGL